MTRASTGKFQWLHSYLPPWHRTTPIPAAQGPSTNKKRAKRSTTVDGGIIVIISPSFLFRTYLCTYLFLDVERELGTRFDCLGWVVFTWVCTSMSVLGCCSTLPVCACSWKGWSKRRSRLSTSQGFVQKTAGERSIGQSIMSKSLEKNPRKVQCTGYHTVPYLTASLSVNWEIFRFTSAYTSWGQSACYRFSGDG